MSFGSNVQMTTLTTSDVAINGRTRLNGLYYTCGSTASTINLYNGDAVSGDPLVSIVTPAVAGSQNVIIPQGGVLFTDGIYAELGADVTSASLVYMGGSTPAAPAVTTFGTSTWSPSYTMFSTLVLPVVDKSGNAALQFAVTDPASQSWIMGLPVGATFTIAQATGGAVGVFTTLSAVTNPTTNSYDVYTSYAGAGYTPGDEVSLFNMG